MLYYICNVEREVTNMTPKIVKTFNHNDGGREKYFKGTTGDCVTRAIAIASGLDYKKVYDDLFALNKEYVKTSNDKVAKAIRKRANGYSPRDGMFKDVYHKYILGLGFKWIPTMTIGSGCKVHLHHSELPKGTLIARVSRHLCAVIDGCINDTYDCSRGGKRCVYGYYLKEPKDVSDSIKTYEDLLKAWAGVGCPVAKNLKGKLA